METLFSKLVCLLYFVLVSGQNGCQQPTCGGFSYSPPCCQSLYQNYPNYPFMVPRLQQQRGYFMVQPVNYIPRATQQTRQTLHIQDLPSFQRPINQNVPVEIREYPRNNHQQHQEIVHQRDPYANIPVEIIDIPTGQKVQNHHQRSDKLSSYTNIPVEILDISSRANSKSFKQFLPHLPKSKTSYSVNAQSFQSSDLVTLKPFKTTITRVLEPNKVNPSIDLNIVNGWVDGESEEAEEVTTTTTEPPTTTEIPTTTTEETEDPKPINAWSFNK